MSIFARQSSARGCVVGPILDAAGVAVTSAVIADLKISKNGGIPGALVDSTLTHRHTGHYTLHIDPANLDVIGSAEIVIDSTTNAMPVKAITVVTAVVYNALFNTDATGALDVNLKHVNDVALTGDGSTTPWGPA
jgi:hypothetical protein